MKTRAQGLASPPLTSPMPLPDTVTIRKRRRESAPAFIKQDVSSPALLSSPVTPRRSKKVRFSDPGAKSLASGLTPWLRGSRISPPVGASPRSAIRRTQRADLPMSPPTSPIVMQFTPMKEVIEDRQKRRLRRSQLSDTMNAIQAEQRAEMKSASQLHHEIAVSEEKIKSLELEVELQRQRGIMCGDESDEIRRLEKDNDFLRTQLLQHTHSAGLTASSPILVDFDDYIDENSHADWSDEASATPGNQNSSQVDFDNASTSRPMREVTTTQDSCCQAELPDQAHLSAIAALDATVTSLKTDNTALQTLLDSIHTQLVSLGFDATSDSTTIITSLDTTFRATRLELERLLPGETPSGFASGISFLQSLLAHITNRTAAKDSAQHATSLAQAAESALRTNLNNTIRRLTRAEDDMQTLLANRTDMLKKNNAKDVEIAELTATISEQDKDIKAKRMRIATLSSEAEDARLGLERLSAALEKYRNEVNSLETMVHTLEAESAAKSGALDAARAAADQAQGMEGLASAAADERLGQLLQMQALLEQEVGEKSQIQHEHARIEEECRNLMNLLESALVKKREAEEMSGRMTEEVERSRRWMAGHVQAVQRMADEVKSEVRETERRKRDSGVSFEAGDVDESMGDA
jgi:hypothetical protein